MLTGYKITVTDKSNSLIVDEYYFDINDPNAKNKANFYLNQLKMFYAEEDFIISMKEIKNG